MPANTTPIFPLVPVYRHVTITAATTDRSGATVANLQTLITGSVDGTKITQIGVKVQGTSVLGSVFIFIDPGGGQGLELFDEIQISSAITANETTPSFRAVNLYNDLQIASGSLVRVGQTLFSGATGSTVFCMAGNY